MRKSKVQKSQNHWVNFFKPQMPPYPSSSPTQLQHKQTKIKSTPCIIENKICSTILIATNFVQAIELLRLHKVQEVSFGDSKYKTHLQQTKIQA